MPVELLGKSAEELREYVASLGERPFRAAQLYHALYAERRFEFAAMTNIPAALRERLAQEARITPPRIARRFPSVDGSIRYLFSIGGENEKPAQIEAVFMPREGRQTICISTQAGCAVDCHFCLTAQLGLIRNLTAGEIVGQVLVALEENREHLAPQTNVVLMGQGEPLLNYDATMAAVRILLDPKGVALAPRHVTLSTSGIVPGIERLGQEKIRPSLAISLNASSDEQRNALMPINRKYPLEVLLEACRKYPLRPREYFTFEYVLLGGVNDTPEDARRVGAPRRAHPRQSEPDPLESRKFAVSRADAGEHRGISAHSRRQGRADVCALLARAGCLRRLRPARAHGNAEPVCGVAVAVEHTSQAAEKMSCFVILSEAKNLSSI